MRKRIISGNLVIEQGKKAFDILGNKIGSTYKMGIHNYKPALFADKYGTGKFKLVKQNRSKKKKLENLVNRLASDYSEVLRYKTMR